MERTTQIQIQLSLTLQCFKDIVDYVQTEMPESYTPEFERMVKLQVRHLVFNQIKYKGMPDSMFEKIMGGLI